MLLWGPLVTYHYSNIIQTTDIEPPDCLDPVNCPYESEGSEFCQPRGGVCHPRSLLLLVSMSFRARCHTCSFMRWDCGYLASVYLRSSRIRLEQCGGTGI